MPEIKYIDITHIYDNIYSVVILFRHQHTDLLFQDQLIKIFVHMDYMENTPGGKAGAHEVELDGDAPPRQEIVRNEFRPRGQFDLENTRRIILCSCALYRCV